MTCNKGNFDKVLRRSAGFVIIGLGVYYKSWGGLLGLLPLVLSFGNYCPLYTVFNINTITKEEKNAGID